jgi:hypothetical protein
MGGHCSQKLCPGGEGTPLRGAADLRINTRSTTLSQRSHARGPVSQAFSFPRQRRCGWLPPLSDSLTSSVPAGIRSPLLSIGGMVPAGPPKWLPPPPPLTFQEDSVDLVLAHQPPGLLNTGIALLLRNRLNAVLHRAELPDHLGHLRRSCARKCRRSHGHCRGAEFSSVHSCLLSSFNRCPLTQDIADPESVGEGIDPRGPHIAHAMIHPRPSGHQKR